MRKFLQCLATLVAVLALCACTSAAPPTAAPAEAVGAAPVPASAVPAPEVPAAEAGTDAEGEVDYSCSTHADCSVKNVGNCCGYYPACVNVDSPTFPERVQAECQEQGMNSICGFPAIGSCVCRAGRCEAGAQNLEVE